MSTTTDTPEIAAPSTRWERVGWYFYDWANSAFSTTATRWPPRARTSAVVAPAGPAPITSVSNALMPSAPRRRG